MVEGDRLRMENLFQVSVDPGRAPITRWPKCRRKTSHLIEIFRSEKFIRIEILRSVRPLGHFPRLVAGDRIGKWVLQPRPLAASNHCITSAVAFRCVLESTRAPMHFGSHYAVSQE
jgi:hypothetical protein